MKKIILVLIVLVFSIAKVEAQKMNRQKIKLLKTSFITDAINLSPTEAEQFWPIYNMYTDKIHDLKRSRDTDIQHTLKSNGGIDNVSEEDAQKTLDHMLSLEKQIGENNARMIKELNKIISAKKIIKLQRAEHDFNRQMLEEFGRRKRMQ